MEILRRRLRCDMFAFFVSGALLAEKGGRAGGWGGGGGGGIADSARFVQSILMSDTVILRGTIVNRTYGTHKNLHIYLFLPTTFGPIYYGPP